MDRANAARTREALRAASMEVKELKMQVQGLEEELGSKADSLKRTTCSRNRIKQVLIKAMKAQRELEQALAVKGKERDEATYERDALRAERGRLRAARDKAWKERDKARQGADANERATQALTISSAVLRDLTKEQDKEITEVRKQLKEATEVKNEAEALLRRQLNKLRPLRYALTKVFEPRLRNVGVIVPQTTDGEVAVLDVYQAMARAMLDAFALGSRPVLNPGAPPLQFVIQFDAAQMARGWPLTIVTVFFPRRGAGSQSEAARKVIGLAREGGRASEGVRAHATAAGGHGRASCRPHARVPDPYAGGGARPHVSGKGCC